MNKCENKIICGNMFSPLINCKITCAYNIMLITDNQSLF